MYLKLVFPQPLQPSQKGPTVLSDEESSMAKLPIIRSNSFGAE